MQLGLHIHCCKLPARFIYNFSQALSHLACSFSSTGCLPSMHLWAQTSSTQHVAIPEEVLMCQAAYTCMDELNSNRQQMSAGVLTVLLASIYEYIALSCNGHPPSSLCTTTTKIRSSRVGLVPAVQNMLNITAPNAIYTFTSTADCKRGVVTDESAVLLVFVSACSNPYCIHVQAIARQGAFPISLTCRENNTSNSKHITS